MNENTYKEAGFRLDNIELKWKWTDGCNTYDRLDYKKASIDKLKLYKIYDAGQAKYVKERKI